MSAVDTSLILKVSLCLSHQFACKNYKCIPLWWKCDTVDDCGDWSDEPKDCCEYRLKNYCLERLVIVNLYFNVL